MSTTSRCGEEISDASLWHQQKMNKKSKRKSPNKQLIKTNQIQDLQIYTFLFQIQYKSFIKNSNNTEMHKI